MTVTTTHASCLILADLLEAHGVDCAVISPGSRNAPLIVALARHPAIETYHVIDERSAAFIALGMSIRSGKPVALVCTSGTALLNYAPAVAEAFYRRIPLIVVSADRPLEWIDQDDSQTLWQQDALAPYVKRSCDICNAADNDNDRWFADRVINDCLLEAVNGRVGPVHINIRLDAPLGKLSERMAEQPRVVSLTTPTPELPTAEARRLGQMLASPRKVMVIAGFHRPNTSLNRALSKLARLPNVIVLTETVANLHSPEFISRIDATLCRITEEEREALRPDVVLTIGGALISRMIKAWIREMPREVEHWHIGISHTTIDCFRHLTRRIEMEAPVFIRQLASALQPHRAPSDYSTLWHKVAERAAKEHVLKIARAPWSDLKAFASLFKSIPRGTDLQLSNGTPVRYAQLMDCSTLHSCECNRGVSGIDGCTSTALGASVFSSGLTLLITGDMSMQYDISALSSTLLSPRLKIIVIENGGGGIFRFIESTRNLDELEEYFVGSVRLPLRQLCEGYGLAYFEAESEKSLERVLGRFFAENTRPALLTVKTPGEVSAEVLLDYFSNHTGEGN
ncbi:MAG: 2-succinyl-5-enolpyruvyl-6-hydroxy-3-cyclohexene-1-carboxylic-acid synthase [Duncaniella sp.]|nr:2-succinyl-5-enolpyruvyl-6-hydroxy-3-cyclohexene-1-carboxylic-acid synthase [Duncaniella sp.]